MKPVISLALAGFSMIPVSGSAAAPATLADRIIIDEVRTVAELDQLLEQIRALPPAQRQLALKAVQIDPRIVGGFPVLIANHPWQVALVRGLAADRLQFCGGSLIAPTLVVTAAHCIDSNIVLNDPRRVDVVAGTGNYAVGGDRIDVQAVYVHPQWDSTNNDYDVAVLRLNRGVTVGTPIALDPQPVSVGARSMVTGWGAVTEGGGGSFELLGVDIPVVATAICNEPQTYGGEVTDRMLCAGEQDGGKDSCQGDSGGPLTTGTGSGARLVGIVSWGEGCARRLKYGVYTKVSEVSPWVSSFLQ